MQTVSQDTLGRTFIFLAVLLQAIGKVAYGTWLADFPSALFVFVSFALTATIYFATARSGTGERAWGPLFLLNAGTALTFICFFYALKLIEPAIVGAVEIGIGPFLAMMLTLLVTGERPTRKRIWVCAGVLLGCAILAVAALRGTGFASAGQDAWLGLVASVAAGAGAVVITMASKSLLNRGWKRGAVLAHRFYLILPVSLAMTLGADDLSLIVWSGPLVVALLAVSLIAVLAPLYLLQLGIGRCDPYTVMVSMTALPVLTFAIEGFSPAYSWSWLTAFGVAVVTAFLVLDVTVGRKSSR